MRNCEGMRAEKTLENDHEEICVLVRMINTGAARARHNFWRSSPG